MLYCAGMLVLDFGPHVTTRPSKFTDLPTSLRLDVISCLGCPINLVRNDNLSATSQKYYYSSRLLCSRLLCATRVCLQILYTMGPKYLHKFALVLFLYCPFSIFQVRKNQDQHFKAGFWSGERNKSCQICVLDDINNDYSSQKLKPNSFQEQHSSSLFLLT